MKFIFFLPKKKGKGNYIISWDWNEEMFLKNDIKAAAAH